MTIKVYYTIADMLRELHRAKIIRLSEYRLVRSAMGWVPDFDKYLATLLHNRDPKVLAKRLAKIQAERDRRDHNNRVIRAYGLRKNTTKKGPFYD